MSFSFDLNPPPLVEDPDRFYRSGERFFFKPALNVGDLRKR